MSKRSILVSALTALLLSASPVSAKSTLWDTYNKAGVQAYASGRYEEAARLLNEAIQAAQAGNDHGFRLAQTLCTLGTVYKDLGRYDEADKVMTQAIAICESNFLASFSLPLAIQNKAALHWDRGQYREATELLTKATQLAERKFGLKSEVAQLSLNNLANMYTDAGNYAEAEKVLAHLEPVFRKKPQTMYYAYYVANLGKLATAEGKFAAAEPALKESYNLAAIVLVGQPKYGGQLKQLLAELYLKEGRYADAERDAKEAVAIAEKSTSPESADTSRALQTLASIYIEQGKYREAEPLCKRAFDNYENSCGPGTVQASEALCLLAQIREQTGDYAEAERMFKDALKRRQVAYGGSGPKVRDALKQLGICYTDQGKFAEAEEYLKKALAAGSGQEKFTAFDPETAKVNIALARCYAKQDRFADAQAAYQQSLDVLKAVFGQGTTQFADAERELAEVLFEQKQFAAAQAAYTHVLGIAEKNTEVGSCKTKLAADYDMLAKVYAALNDSANATQMTQKAQELKKALPSSQFLAELENSNKSSATDAQLAAKPVADKWALVVGVSNFQDPTINLKYATKDAIDFRNFLVNQAHFQSDHVKLLTDAQASRENIIGQLGDKWLGRLANRDDLVVVYISSHGSSAQEQAGGVNFLVAHDTRKNSLLATGIPMQWLTSIVKDQIHSDRVVLILDVCHGAAAAGGSKALVRTNGVDVDGLALGKGQAVLCSSLADQLSWESKTYQNSVFTRKLIEALSVNGEKTTLRTAYEFLRAAVESEVLRDRGELQTPVLNEKLWVGTDAMLSVKPSNPRPGL